MRAPATDRGRLLLVLAAGTAVTVFTATVPLLRDWFDLRVYHGAVDTWVHHGGRLYDYRVPGTAYGFTYPPFAAVAMLPMALLDLRAAIAVGLLLNLAALAVVVRLLTGRPGGATAGTAVPWAPARSRCSNRCGTRSASARSTSCCWPSSSSTRGCSPPAGNDGPVPGSAWPPR